MDEVEDKFDGAGTQDVKEAGGSPADHAPSTRANKQRTRALLRGCFEVTALAEPGKGGTVVKREVWTCLFCAEELLREAFDVDEQEMERRQTERNATNILLL